jgi:hypothetical protein
LHKAKGASAEVDYVIAHGTLPVPIEVKAAATGSLKSLHVFMELKKLSKAVRVCSGLPNSSLVEIRSAKDSLVRYELRSIPFYLLGEIHRLIS